MTGDFIDLTLTSESEPEEEKDEFTIQLVSSLIAAGDHSQVRTDADSSAGNTIEVAHRPRLEERLENASEENDGSEDAESVIFVASSPERQADSAGPVQMSEDEEFDTGPTIRPSTPPAHTPPPRHSHNRRQPSAQRTPRNTMQILIRTPPPPTYRLRSASSQLSLSPRIKTSLIEDTPEPHAFSEDDGIDEASESDEDMTPVPRTRKSKSKSAGVDEEDYSPTKKRKKEVVKGASRKRGTKAKAKKVLSFEVIFEEMWDEFS